MLRNQWLASDRNGWPTYSGIAGRHGPEYADIVKIGAAAFFGAYFAFVFSRIAEHLRRIYDRQKKHYDALVRFEHEINNYLTIIADHCCPVNFSSLLITL